MNERSVPDVLCRTCVARSEKLNRRRSLLLACVFGNLLVVAGVQSTAAAAETDQVRELKPLAEALAEFSSRRGLQVIYVSAIVAGRHSSGHLLPAGLSPQEELQLILEGTGLRFEFLSRNTVGIFVDETEKTDADSTLVSKKGDLKMSDMRNSKKKARRIARGSVVALSLAGAAAGAQEGALLEEVVVSAQRREERVEDVPLSITVQNGESLERAGVTSIQDLGNVVPSLSFNTQGPFASATIRGVQSMIHQADLSRLSPSTSTACIRTIKRPPSSSWLTSSRSRS